MKKAIIFGITGQDGSHLADLLLEKEYEVVGVSRRASTDNTQRIKHILGNENFHLVQGDITDAYSVINILKKHSKGCLNILQSIVDLGIDARFYQASSSEMFGRNYDIDRSQSKFQNEDTKFMPQSPYAIAKCAAHHMTTLFREAYDIHSSAGILFNHEGERRGETFVTRKITKWIGDWVKSGKDLNFPKLRLGNLEAFRDWGYAGDYVEAMWMMLQQDSPQDYVICTGKTHTIREFLDVAFLHVGVEDWSDLVLQDPEFYRPAEVDYLRGDCSKANKILGWTPKHSFEDLVKKMVEHDIS